MLYKSRMSHVSRIIKVIKGVYSGRIRQTNLLFSVSLLKEAVFRCILLSYIESKLIIIISSFRLSHVIFLGIDLRYRLVEFTGQIMRDTMCGKRGKIAIQIERQNVKNSCV